MAKRFTFRFETLLRLRQQREDEEKRVVAARLRQIQALTDQQMRLRDQILAQTNELRTALSSEQLDINVVRDDRHCIGRLRREIIETDAEIARHRVLLAQERQSLAHARKETKILERLREHQEEKYLHELNRREQLEQDEMNVTRFAYAVLAEEGDAS